jgi:hypothetical protein
MAVTVKENQALGFDISKGCGCGGDYCQPFQTDDSFMLQTILTAANNTNLCPEGEFDSSSTWTLPAGFSVAGGKLLATNVGAGVATSGNLGLVAGRIYLIQSKITMTSANPSAGNGYSITINSAQLSFPDSNTHYNDDLTASWIYRPPAIATDRFEIVANVNCDFEIDYFRVYEFSNLGLAIYDNNGSPISAHTSFSSPNSLKYKADGAELPLANVPIIATGEYAYNGVSVLADLYIDSWNALTAYTGCITVEIFDALYYQNRIKNGTFTTDLEFWTAGGNWSWDTNRAKYTYDGLSADLLTQTVILKGGATYTLSFTHSGLGFNKNASVFIDTGSGSQQYLVEAFYTSPYEITIDISDMSGNVEVDISFSEGTNPDSFSIDNVSVIANEYVGSTSECIDLQTSHSCTLLFYGNNNDNAFGFDYSVGFRHYLRIYGKIGVIGFPEEVEGTFRFSDGSLKNLYAVSDTEYEVIIGDAPEYVHSCLRLLRLHDIFQVDGVEYVRTGDYGLKTRKSSDLLQANFNVKPAQGLLANYSCI